MYSNKKGFSFTVLILCLYIILVLITQVLKSFMPVNLPNTEVNERKQNAQKEKRVSHESDIYKKVSFIGQNRNKVSLSDSDFTGIIDENGKYIINPEYKEIKKCGYYMFCAKNEQGYFLFDWNGNLIKKSNYIKAVDGLDSKYLIIREDDENSSGHYFYDKNMKKIFSFSVPDNAVINVLGKRYLQITGNNIEKLYDYNGKLIFSLKDKHVFKFTEKNNNVYFWIRDSLSGATGIIDINNKIIVPFKYYQITAEPGSDYLWGLLKSYYTCYDYGGKIIENPDMSKAPLGDVTKIAGYNYGKLRVPPEKFFVFDENNRPQGITKYGKVTKAGENNYIIWGYPSGNNVIGISDKYGNILVKKNYNKCEYAGGYIFCNYFKGVCSGTANWISGGKYCIKFADIYYTDGKIKKEGALCQ